MTRYLTATEKDELIASWAKQLADLPKDHPHGGKGDGSPDPVMDSWVQQINVLRGMAVCQSCAGHKFSEDMLQSGCLWIRPSVEMARVFYAQAFELAVKPGMDRVRVLFGYWGEELIEIRFAGQEQGRLLQSMDAILQFLRGVSDLLELPEVSYVQDVTTHSTAG